MNKHFLIIIISIGIVSFLGSNNAVCYSKDQTAIKDCEDIFVLLNPNLLTANEINLEIKKTLPNATVLNIEDNYIVKIQMKNCDTKKFNKAINEVLFNLPDRITGEYLSVDELRAIQRENVFCKLAPHIIVSSIGKNSESNNKYQVSINVMLTNRTDKVLNSVRYLVFDKSNIYKFLRDNSAFLNVPFLDTKDKYLTYLKEVEENFRFLTVEKGIFRIEIVSEDKRFVNKAATFFQQEFTQLFDDLKTGNILLHRNIFDSEYETIFLGTAVWRKKHKVIVKETKGELKKKLEETRISCSFANIYLRDFLEFLRQESQISVHIRHNPNFTGKKIDINIPNELATIGGNIKFMGSHVFSIRAEDVKLGTLLEEVLKQLGYRYEIGISGGLEVLFIEPI